MIKRRAAATAVRPCLRPDPGSPPSSFPQVTCLDRSGRPVLTPLLACEMRARPALAVLVWSGDGSPFGDVPPRSGFKSPSDTRTGAISPKPGTTRTRQPTDRSPRPPGVRVAVTAACWPGGSRDRPAHRPVIPFAASQVTVGRGTGRAWPVPCRWRYCRLGGLRSPGSAASTLPAGSRRDHQRAGLARR
jgi:hypothetical protein